jgi:hypothetical protein
MPAYRPSHYPDFDPSDLHAWAPDSGRDSRIELYARRILAGKPLFEKEPNSPFLMEKQSRSHGMPTVAG